MGFLKVYTSEVTDAQPEIQHLAALMFGTPHEIGLGGRHMAFIQVDERGDSATRRKLSVARCRPVSLLTLKAGEIAADLEFCERLMTGGASGVWSPTEHVATALDNPCTAGAKFRGAKHCRKLFRAENAATFPDEIARTG